MQCCQLANFYLVELAILTIYKYLVSLFCLMNHEVCELFISLWSCWKQKIPNLATFYDIVNRIIYGHFHRTVIGHILADMDLSHFWRIHCHFDWSCTWILKTGFKDILKLEVPMYLFLEFTNSMKNVTKQVKKTSSRVNSFWKHRAVIFETFARK